MAAAPDRSRQYIQRRLNLNQGQIANLGSRAAALEESTRDLGSSFVVVKRFTGQFNPMFCFDELREHSDVTVVPMIHSTVENYPARAPNTLYKLRHSAIADYTQPVIDGLSANHPKFLPMLPRVFSVKASGPVNWSQGLKDGYVTIGTQSFAYMGDVKGPWQPATEYKFGDKVVVQARYPTFMNMPATQTMLFVFNCMRDHTSGDLSSYANFWCTNPAETTYFDASNNPTVPMTDVNFDDQETWRLNTYEYVRQFWPWNPATNSVEAVLFTEAMTDLYYPIHNNSAGSLLLDDHGNTNMYHSRLQEQGILVLVDGKLTMWHSNWWKTQSVRSGAGSLTLPLTDAPKQFVIDGDILWTGTTDFNRNDANVFLPIDSRVKPFARLTLLVHTYTQSYQDVEVQNVTGSHLYDATDADADEPGGNESISYVFDSIRGMWLTENT